METMVIEVISADQVDDELQAIVIATAVGIKIKLSIARPTPPIDSPRDEALDIALRYLDPA